MNSDHIVLPENQTDLKTGQIKFYNNYLVKLPAGDYKVSLKQSIESDGLEEKVFVREQEFEVSGPRFCLPEGEIHSVYPPPNGEEYYEGVLPQIVFRKRTLPWERSVDSKSEKAGFEIPWMALLLFEEQELLLGGQADRKNASRTRAVSRSVEELKSPGPGYLPPINLNDGLADETSCYTIDISKNDFLALVPKASELPYLAHVREVNTDDKEFLGMHADGWFSVILSNRLPKTPPVQQVTEGSLEEKKGLHFARNIVHLVSLEGFIGYLEDKPHPKLRKTAYQKVRLASLASWEFYCKPPMESFSKLMENLDADLLRLKTEEKQLHKHPYLKTAFEGGYIPMQYCSRNGEKTMAWYRGPLIPVINEYSPEVKDDDVFFSVEASMIYDDQNGIFDLSQSVAWQIGRLLALNDTHFSQTLLDWKIKVNRQVDEMLKRQSLVLSEVVNTSSLPELDDSFEKLDLDKIQTLMKPDFATEIFSDNFLKQLAIAREFFEKLDSAPDLLEAELAGFPGILKTESYQNLLLQGKDPRQDLVKEILK